MILQTRRLVRHETHAVGHEVRVLLVRRCVQHPIRDVGDVATACTGTDRLAHRPPALVDPREQILMLGIDLAADPGDAPVVGWRSSG